MLMSGTFFKSMPERWEHGSDFHCLDFYPSDGSCTHPWSAFSSANFGSGRDALRALLGYGAETYGWKRIFFPTFYCQEVIAAMRIPGIELAVYPDAPGETPQWPKPIGQDDVVLVVNFFGLREKLDSSELRESGAFIVEDHTHDPWSRWANSSDADYCLVALRKSLPVPEGGVLWSPRCRVLPNEPLISGERQLAADAKRAGMHLKRLYLAGHAVPKEVFRALLTQGEECIASGVIAGMTLATRPLLECMPVEYWREQRLRNFEVLAAALEKECGFRVLKPEGSDCVPFNVTVVADTQIQREILKEGLISKRIYPAILWSLEKPVVDGIPEQHVQLSRRLLGLHCDSRYVVSDFHRVALSATEAIGLSQ